MDQCASHDNLCVTTRLEKVKQQKKMSRSNISNLLRIPSTVQLKTEMDW